VEINDIQRLKCQSFFIFLIDLPDLPANFLQTNSVKMKKSKPRLSFWQIWNMSFGFLGIQIGFALQNANVSRIFETLGAKVDDIPILWVAAPVTGLIIQPIIGHMSDRTWTRMGRRRPYFLIGALLASIALCIITNSPTWLFAAGILWIMDASINISMEPFRAFVGDMLVSEQRTTGFAMQSFFIGLGAVIGSFLPWILVNWFNVPELPSPGKLLPLNLKLSFYLGAGIFFCAVLWTVLRTKEYSPEALKEFAEAEDPEVKRQREVSETVVAARRLNFYLPGSIWLGTGLILTFILSKVNLEKELYVITGGVSLFGILQIVAGALQSSGRGKNGLNSILSDLRNMPKTMGQLAVVQFFTWFALFSMWIYTTSAVTSRLYGTTDTTSLAYNEGANWVGVLFGIYNGCAALVAFLLPVLARATSRKITHSLCLIIGGISLISINLVSAPWQLVFPMAGIGIAWASILSMPYAILTGALPQNKMGIYMGIFNFFIVIPQILAASILGSMVKHMFSGNTMNALIAGGFSMIIAALMVRFVNDVDDRRNK
jgi:maltose/moltooligosaccharide transporter